MAKKPLALIIIFQPEIRNVLESIGRTQLLGRHKTLTVDEREKVVYEIVNAVEYLKRMRIGALIVIERDNSLNDYIEKSKKLYADYNYNNGISCISKSCQYVKQAFNICKMKTSSRFIQNV